MACSRLHGPQMANLGTPDPLCFPQQTTISSISLQISFIFQENNLY